MVTQPRGPKGIRIFVGSLIIISPLVFMGCGAAAPTETGPRIPSTSPASTSRLLPICCVDQNALNDHAGQRVRVRGVYRRQNVSKRPSKTPVDPQSGGTAFLEVNPNTDNKLWLWLGVYHQASGQRSEVEVRKYNGKLVEVWGVIHRRTPEIVHEGIAMATMISPYLEVERMVAVPAGAQPESKP